MPSFSELKALALRCKQKEIGHCISASYRLHYNDKTNTVTMYERWSGNRSVVVSTPKHHQIVLKDEYIEQGLYATLFNLYRINIEKLPQNICKYLDFSYVSRESGNKHYPIIQNTSQFDWEGNQINLEGYNVYTVSPEYRKEFNRKKRKLVNELYIMFKLTGLTYEECRQSWSVRSELGIQTLIDILDNPTNIDEKSLKLIRYFASDWYKNDISYLKKQLQSWIGSTQLQIAKHTNNVITKQLQGDVYEAWKTR